MTKMELNDRIAEISKSYSVDNWDSKGAVAISDVTIKHGYRFINKLEKYQIIDDHLSIYPLEDDNLSFQWFFPETGCKFNIDFDKLTDSLNWCCFKDINNHWNGNCSHLEEIVEYIKKVISYHTKK